MLDLTPSVVAIAAAVLVVLILVVALVRRYKIAGPSEAFIVTGRKGKPVTNPETGRVSTDLSGQKVVMGGGVFVLPFVQQSYSLSLASRRISVQIRGAVSAKGIRLNLDGVAIIKVGGTEDSVRAAAQRFLQQQDEIESFTQEVLAGSLRSIVGTLTVDEIIRDRAAFASRVAEEAESSLTNQGLVLDTFQIQDVSDDVNYLRDLGRPEAAVAAQNAAIAEANSLQESQQAEARAQAQVAAAQRDLSLRQAEFKAETDTAQARADAAGVLAKAARDQEVLVEQERVAQRQAELTERQLDTEVRRPADARRYEAEQQAQARRNSEIFEAEAEANRITLAAEADAQRVRVAGQAELDRRRALAEATRLEGEAEAAAIRARGEAEAETMRLRAEAFEKYGDAAVAQMVTDVLPQVARELAAPMAAIDDLTVISTDGASQLARSVGTNLTETLEVVKRTTGLDLQELLGRLTPRDGATGASAAGPRTVRVAPGSEEPTTTGPATVTTTGRSD